MKEFKSDDSAEQQEGTKSTAKGSKSSKQRRIEEIENSFMSPEDFYYRNSPQITPYIFHKKL